VKIFSKRCQERFTRNDKILWEWVQERYLKAIEVLEFFHVKLATLGVVDESVLSELIQYTLLTVVQLFASDW